MQFEVWYELGLVGAVAGSILLYQAAIRLEEPRPGARRHGVLARPPDLHVPGQTGNTSILLNGIGTGLDLPQCVGYGTLRVGPKAVAGKGIRRQVQDSHDQCFSRLDRQF